MTQSNTFNGNLISDIPGSTLDDSAILSVASTTKGFLPPCMTTTQRDAIDTPANGLIIYNTTTLTTQQNVTGTGWTDIAAVPALVHAKYSTLAGQSIGAASATIVNFGTKEVDTHDAVTTGASWKFTVPEGCDGIYLITGMITFASLAETAGHIIILRVYKDGADTPGGFLFRQVVNSSITFLPGGYCGATTLDLVAGNYIDLRAYTTAANTLHTDVNLNYVSVTRLGA